MAKLRIVAPTEASDLGAPVSLTEENKAAVAMVSGHNNQAAQGAGLAPIPLRTTCDRNPQSIINRATLRYHADVAGEFKREITVNAEASQSDYGQVRAIVVDAYGIYDTDDLSEGAAAWETQVVAPALAYFSKPLALCRRSFDLNLATQLYPGVKVLVTDNALINPATGTRGVTDLLAWVLSTTFDWSTGVGLVEFCFSPETATSSTTNRLAIFAPSARVDEQYIGVNIETSTVALFKFNELAVAGTGYATAVDAAAYGGTQRDLSEDLEGSGSSVNYTHIVNGPGGKVAGEYARWFPGVVSGAYLTRAADAEATAILLDVGWSVEAWVRPTLSARGAILSYQLGNGVTADYMAIFQFYIDTDGTLGLFYETGLGSPSRPFERPVSTGAVEANEWSHVAVTTDRDGATTTVKFYINGVAAGTTTGLTHGADGTGGWGVGHATGSLIAYHGAIKDIRVSTRVREQSEIQTSATAADYHHEVDADTLALWRLNEPPDALEESDYGYHARLVTGSIDIEDPLASDNGKARDMGTASYYICHWGYEPLRAALAGDWTFSCWTKMNSGYTSAQRGLWLYGGDVTSETQANNATFVDLLTTKVLRTFWEHGSGTNDSKDTASPIFATTGDGENAHHIALTFYEDTPGNYKLEFYFDGLLVETMNATTRFDGGTIGYLTLGLGGGTSSSFDGIVDDMHWLSVRRTASEIADSTGWLSGYLPGSKLLQLKAHEYSLDSEDVDTSWFEVGDAVHVVDLSPTDPDDPEEWFDTVASVDTTLSRIGLTTGLASWPDRGHFVVEFNQIDEVETGQMARGAFIADDTTRSTGNAANDAYRWGGDPLPTSEDVEFEEEQPYRRLDNSADNVGTALSVHKLHELSDWLNTAMAWHTRPVFVNDYFLQPATHATGVSEILLYGPIWVPLYAGSTRGIQVIVKAAMNTGTDGGATLRARTDTVLPTDDDDFHDPSWDPAGEFVDMTLPETTTYANYTGTIDTPAVRFGAVPGCWLTITAALEDVANGKVNLAAVWAMEAPPE